MKKNVRIFSLFILDCWEIYFILLKDIRHDDAFGIGEFRGRKIFMYFHN